MELVKFEIEASVLTETEALRDTAQGLIVESESSAATAIDLTGTVKKIGKRLETLRVEKVTPYNDQVKAINNSCKRVSEQLASIEADLKGKILRWKQAEEAKRRAEEEELKRQIQRIAEEAAAKAEAENKPELAEVHLARAIEIEQAPAPALPFVPLQTRGETSNAATVKRWTFEVMDHTLVPREFLTVDEKAIREAIRTGAREIAGVRIYQSESLSIR